MHNPQLFEPFYNRFLDCLFNYSNRRFKSDVPQRSRLILNSQYYSAHTGKKKKLVNHSNLYLFDSFLQGINL